MRNHDAVLRRLETVLDDERAVGVSHFQAVDHHDRADGYFHPRPSQPQHLGKMSVLEVKLPGALVVFLVERAAGDEDSDGHQTESKKEKVGSRKDKPSRTQMPGRVGNYSFKPPRISTTACAIAPGTMLRRHAATSPKIKP